MRKELPLTEDEKSLIIDMLKSEGWKIYSEIMIQQIEDYRFLATQQPGAAGLNPELRTWYSALAAGREEAIEEIKKLVE